MKRVAIMEALERRISSVGGNGNGTAESEDTVANANNNANEVGVNIINIVIARTNLHTQF